MPARTVTSRLAMPLAVLVLLIAAWAATEESASARAGHAAARHRRPGGVLTPRGRVGPFRISRTKPARVRRRYGAPSQRIQIGSSDPPSGFQLIYRCGDSCSSLFTFSYATERLVEFSTNSRRYHTNRGTRVGDSRAQARSREEVPVTYGPCGIEVLERASRRFALESWVGEQVGTLYVSNPSERIVPC